MAQPSDVQPTPTHSDCVAAAQTLLARHHKRALVVVITNFRDEDSPDLAHALRLIGAARRRARQPVSCDEAGGVALMAKTMTRSTFQPKGWPTVTPRIFAEDAKGLVKFVRRVFGAAGEYREDRPAEIRIGDSVVMITDAGIRPATAAFLYVYVADSDAVFKRAIAAGAHPLEQPAEMPYGDRRGMFEDAWGNTWQVATHRRPPRSSAGATARPGRRPRSR